jgi:hypothetical protein
LSRQGHGRTGGVEVDVGGTTGLILGVLVTNVLSPRKAGPSY